MPRYAVALTLLGLIGIINTDSKPSGG